ncbi:MAG: protease modulator HflK N-terminal domain-containing protein, partial [Methylobacterium radiotolerans]
MPWSNQSGGGGPWGRPGGNGGGPWGGGSGGGGGKTPPNLEDLLRRGQDRLRGLIPGGGGGSGGGYGGGSTGVGGGRSAAVIAVLAVAIWLATGFYTVYPRQVGIETIFGRYVGTKGEGLRYNFPYPIGGVVKPD